jgi:hypothetical protein
MEHQSIVDHNSAVAVAEPGTGKTLPATLSVSAGIAAVTANPPRFFALPSATHLALPAEDGGHSLAEMACNDLDAALQLLAERAQYITGATGAAIALRRGEHNDMLCRASVGSNAPELGALLSMEYGLSGESVRKRQAMRCDDVESDPRVNREGCRRLGISSVVVMPILSDEQALGVFELFSGKPQAFDERDLSALQRLSEMTETAVKHAAAAQNVFVTPASPQANGVAPVANAAAPLSPSALTANHLAPQTLTPQKEEKEAPPKPLFWSTVMQEQTTSEPAELVAESIAAPPILRRLQKCQACGFPVSSGRTFCVECEEKQWRGQAHPRPPFAEQPASSPAQPSPDGRLVALAAAAGVSGIQNSVPAAVNRTAISKPAAVASSSDIGPEPSQAVIQNISDDASSPDRETPFLTSTLESKSWFAANKYILGALLAVAVIVGIVAWLR